MCLVSVIVPNYNHAPYLKQRFDSIFNQTFRDFEVIILDDCSTDNSKEIIEGYRDLPQVTHIIYNEVNSGSPFKQWAKGFNLAQGEYIWIAESDDWAELSFLKDTVSIIKQKKNLSVIFSSSKLAASKAESIIAAFPESKEINGLQFIKNKMIIENSIPNASAVLFRKSCLHSIAADYQSFRGAGDYLFWISLCELGDVYFYNKPLNHFRKHQNNTTNKCLIDGTVCKEAYKVYRYLQKKNYISYWNKNLLILKNIERIKILKTEHSFLPNVDILHLLNLWKKENSFISFKIALIRLYAIIQKGLFHLGIIQKPRNLIFEFFENESFLTFIWKTFYMPFIETQNAICNFFSATKVYLKQMLSYIKRPLNIFDTWASMGRFNWLPDKWYLSLMFRSHMGYWMNWKQPTTYNEKLQWLKIYNKNPLYTQLVDKYEVRKYVASKIGEEHLIPLLGVWDCFDEIDFNQLPNQFVLKCTHDSGSVFICKDKKKFNIDKVKRKITKELSHNFYYNGREWPYKNVKPRIIAEKYMEDSKIGELKDYKFFCFNGEIRALFIASNRQSSDEETKFDFFDQNYNHLPITNGHPNSRIQPQKPILFDEMRIIAKILSREIPHVRIDLYIVGSKIYFGEMTFFHWSGLVPFEPHCWDYEFGSWLQLPPKQDNRANN